MRRLTIALAVAGTTVTAAEPLCGAHGHWPVGFSLVLGLAGSVLLALSAKALAEAGLQSPDSGESEESAET
jgi:hypothetical protein